MTNLITNPEEPFNQLPELPPDNSKTETYHILKQESKSAVALAELKGLARTLPNQNILINGIILREAQASSEIENIVTTQDNLYQALSVDHIKKDPATKEVLRYREALLYGFHDINKKGILNTNSIISIQTILEENNAGLRKLPGTALKNERTGSVIYTPPDNEDIIIELMSNLENYLNEKPEDISPLIKMAIQHYQFESIHPFYDGNGRTGRIINVLYLILHDLLETPVLYLSGYIIEHKDQYYKLLQEVRNNDNWEQWIFFILKGIEVTAKETIDKINKINKLFMEVQQTVKQELPKIYSKDLIEILFMHPYTRIDHLVNGLKVERKAASRYLKSLMNIGLLKHQQVGKEHIYILEDLYELFQT